MSLKGNKYFKTLKIFYFKIKKHNNQYIHFLMYFEHLESNFKVFKNVTHITEIE